MFHGSEREPSWKRKQSQWWKGLLQEASSGSRSFNITNTDFEVIIFASSFNLLWKETFFFLLLLFKIHLIWTFLLSCQFLYHITTPSPCLMSLFVSATSGLWCVIVKFTIKQWIYVYFGYFWNHKHSFRFDKDFVFVFGVSATMLQLSWMV